jgi:hypothetical protein
MEPGRKSARSNQSAIGHQKSAVIDKRAPAEAQSCVESRRGAPLDKSGRCHFLDTRPRRSEQVVSPVRRSASQDLNSTCTSILSIQVNQGAHGSLSVLDGS